MLNLMIILLWLVFSMALSLTVFQDVIPDRAEKIMIILAAPILTSMVGYSIHKMTDSDRLTEERRKWIRIAGYLFGASIGAMFLLFNNLHNIAQMAFTALLGLLAIGMSIMIYERTNRTQNREWHLSIEDWIFSGVWLVFVMAIISAFVSGKLINPVGAVSILLFGTLTLYFTFYTATLLIAGHSLAVESNWGGIGAGMGGWRVSRPMVFMILAIFFGWLTVVLLTHTSVPPIGVAKPQSSTEQKQNLKTKEESKTPASKNQTPSLKKSKDNNTDVKKG